MKINRRVVFGLLLAGLLFVTGILLRDVLLAIFVKPIALALWIGTRLISSIDQSIYWAGLVGVLILLSIIRYSQRSAVSETEQVESRNATLNRIGHWRSLILMTTDESDRLNYLKQSLQMLLKDMYASKEPLQVPWKVYQDIDDGEILLPGSISKFLMLGPSSHTPPTLMQRLQRIIQAPVRWVRHETKQDLTEYYQSIAEVISFMEKELEATDDK